MKKLYLSFILLFGVFTFVPQIALGDSIGPMRKPEPLSDEEKQEIEKEELSCIYKRKEQLPKEYIGPNLISIVVPKNSFYREKTIKTSNIGLLSAGKYVPCFPTKNTYNVDIQKKDMVYIAEIKSKVCGCKEYIEVFRGYYDHRDYGYNVTEVPSGSYLKYISEKQMQVLPPTERSRQEIIKRHKEQLKIINKRLKAERNKNKSIRRKQMRDMIVNIISDNKVSASIFVLGIFVLIAIFLREIFKKFRK